MSNKIYKHYGKIKLEDYIRNILENNNYDQKFLTESGIKILFPFVKEIIEDVTKKGGSVPILLNEIDFKLRKV